MSPPRPPSILPLLTTAIPLAPARAASPRVAAPGAARVELAPVRCFRCGRRGLVPPRQLLERTAQEILCPKCRGVSAPPAPARPVPVPNPAASTLRPMFPPARRQALVGRPPLILVRSKASLPAAATQTRLEPNRIVTFAVRCFRCGRTGRMPIRSDLSLRPELVLCPTCRAPSPRSARAALPSSPAVPRAAARGRATTA